MTSSGPNIVIDGLIMQLDAADPRSYPGSGSAWNDLSGYSYNGTLTNSPTYSTNNNGYLAFNGTSQYVSIANGSTKMPLSGNNFSISCWFYLTRYSPLYTIQYSAAVFASNSFTNAGLLFTVNGTASTWTGLGIFANVGALTNNSPTYNFGLNQWYHVCLTHTSAGIWTYYVNGTAIGTFSNAGTWTDYSPYVVGFNNYTGTSYQYYFPGYISTVQIYNTALTANQVAQNFEAYRGRYGI